MVKVKQDLTDMTFGRLTVIKQVEDHIKPNGQHIPQWLCECNCVERKQVVVWGEALKRKKNPTRSCGCLQKEKASEVAKKNKKYNKYDLSGEYGIGWTSNTNREFYFDLEDYDKIKNICWLERTDKSTSKLYGRNPDTDKPILMHSLLGYKYYDHIDRNELNNRKSNLRPCTNQENSRNSSRSINNTSGYIGVCFSNKDQCWLAYITLDYKTKYLGLFNIKDDAIKARLNAELKYFGTDFAPQRHLFKEYGIIQGVQNDDCN